MGKSEMSHIADLMDRALKGKNVKDEIVELKKGFQEVKYCYGKERGYDFIELYK